MSYSYRQLAAVVNHPTHNTPNPQPDQWLGDNGEIVVELPREDGDDVGNEDDDGGGDSDGNGEGKKGKGKAKPHRFTAVSGVRDVGKGVSIGHQ